MPDDHLSAKLSRNFGGRGKKKNVSTLYFWWEKFRCSEGFKEEMSYSFPELCGIFSTKQHFHMRNQNMRYGQKKESKRNQARAKERARGEQEE